jgi:hypothetical protein
MADELQGRMSHGARHRARYREIAAVLWEERLFHLFRGTGLEEHLSAETAGEKTAGTKETKERPTSQRT